MSPPLASAIIPAYNRAASIRTAVESALGQTVSDLEVIVVDDGSTDTTREVVNGIDDSRVRLITRDRNGGASAARNTGISSSRGSIIAFLDSDDTWMPEKLERQLATLQAAPGGTAVSCTGVEMHLLDHGITRIQYLDPVDDWARRLAMGCDLNPGTTQVARREIFDEIGLLDENLPRFEDWDWLLRYTRRRAIATVRDPLARVYNRRARLGETVAVAAERFLAKHAEVLAQLSPPDRRAAITDLRLQVTGTYAFEGNFGAAWPSAWLALRQRPLHTVARLASGARAVIGGRLTCRR